jgi:hypothetical protein
VKASHASDLNDPSPYNDNDNPASLATVNRSVCIPSTTQLTGSTPMRSLRIGGIGVSRFD